MPGWSAPNVLSSRNDFKTRRRAPTRSDQHRRTIARRDPLYKFDREIGPHSWTAAPTLPRPPSPPRHGGGTPPAADRTRAGKPDRRQGRRSTCQVVRLRSCARPGRGVRSTAACRQGRSPPARSPRAGGARARCGRHGQRPVGGADVRRRGWRSSWAACLPGVRTWLRRLGAALTGLQIRFFLVSERPQSVAITGVRARPHGHASVKMKTFVIAACSRDVLDLSDHEVQWVQLDLSRNGGTALFGDMDNRLDLDLGRGDTIEMRLQVDAKPPGHIQRWSLDLDHCGRQEVVSAHLRPAGSFVLAPPLSDSAPTIQVG